MYVDIDWSIVILLDYPIHIDAKSMELSVLYLKWLLVKLTIIWRISVSEDFYLFAKELILESRFLLFCILEILNEYVGKESISR